MVLLRHTISTMYHGIIFKSCKKNTLYYNKVCHRRTNKESVLSADVGPSETNIIYRYNNNNNNNNNIYLKSSIQTSSIDYKKYNDIYN